MADSENSLEYTNKIIIDVDVHRDFYSDSNSSTSDANDICPKTLVGPPKEVKIQKDDDSNTESSVSSIDQKRAKTPAERSREYRARKKKEIEEANGGLSNQKRPKTPAERAREYRARKKRAIEAARAASSIQPKRPKTAADYSREYRARKRNAKLAANGISLVQQKRPKTPAERSREYRARKKSKQSGGEISSVIHEKFLSIIFGLDKLNEVME